MPLSDKEIKELLEKAEHYLNSWSDIEDDEPYIKLALDCYNQIIENTPSHPHYFAKRASIKRALSDNDELILDEAIKDIDKAIELDPDRGEFYAMRGFGLWEKLELKKRKGNIPGSEENQLLGKIKADYKACISRNPTEPLIWLELITVNIISENWDESISFYGQCKPYIVSLEDKLIRSWLGCLALTFAGDTSEEEDLKPLYDHTIRMSYPEAACNISSFLNKIREKEKYGEKLEKAIEIHKLFIEHFDNLVNKGILYKRLACYEESLKVYGEAIKLNPKFGQAYYNRACVYSIKGDKENALINLSKAVDLISIYKEEAKKDADFKNLWDDPDFLALTE